MSQGWNQERYLEEIERREAQSARAKKRLIRQSVILGVVITTCLIMGLTIGTAPKVTRSEALIPKTTEPVDTPVETAPDCSRHTWTNDLDPRCHPTTTEVVMRHKTNTTIHISHPTTSIARHTTTTISTAMQISSWCATFSQVVVSGTDGQINQIAELEGQKLLPAFEQLVAGWLNQGHELVTMGELHKSWEATKQLDKIAVLPLTWGEIPNRSGDLIIQNN